MRLSETATRVLVAAVGIPIALAIILIGSWPLVLLMTFITITAALEFFRLAERKGAHPLQLFGAIIAALFILLAGIDPAAGPEGAHFSVLLVFILLLIPAATIWTRGVPGQPILSVSVTLTGACYTGVLLSFALFLRYLPGQSGALHGTALLFAPLLLTWASDTFAYFVGRQWGRRKLIPSISPGKTIAGAIGALCGTVLVALGYRFILELFPAYHLSLGAAVLFGIVISVAAQVGDLAESLFKRDAQVKDSGALLPGHGGALDRFDSLLFTLPLGYFFLRLFGDGVSPF